tara:strand:- start:93 stop:326 length:234 start_codon:yes stop_codon:yes gene_type:complete
MDSSTKNIIFNEILDILKNEDVKSQIKKMFRPIIDMLLVDIYPYIMLSMFFVIISFFIILGNFILLLRSRFLYHDIK